MSNRHRMKNLFMKLRFKNFLCKITPSPLFVVILFSLTFFSIPLFSFQPKLNYITWALTILLLASMFLRLLKNGHVFFDLISLSSIGFIVSVFISLSLNKFVNFVPTSIYLQLIILLFYTYFSSDIINKKQVLFGTFIATLLFAFIFVFKYRNEILSLSFDRLGDDFGDINDMAIFVGLGFTFGYYYFIVSKKWYFKLLSLLSCLLFAVCGLCTGSKIVFFLIFISFFMITLMTFGKKQWYFSLALIVLFIALIVLLFTVPTFSTIKIRLLEMISTLLGRSIGGVNTNDGSTIGRFEMFLGGIQMFFRKPLFGWGPWGFATFGGFEYAWSHNNISESLCNFGLVGSILFHFGLGMSIVSFLKSHNKKNLVLPFSIIVFFIVMMLGVALNSQKIYAYLLPVLLSMIVDKPPYRLSFNLRSKKMNEEVSLSNSSYSERKIRLIEIIPSLKLRGGAEVFCTSLCREIIAQGNVDLKIIVLHPELHETFKDLMPYIVFCGKNKKIDFKAAEELKKQVFSFKPDFVHTHLSCLMTYLLAFGFRNRNFEYFHTVHNIPKKESKFIQRQVNKFFFRFRTRHLIGISDRITDECRGIYKNIDIETIYNGFKIESKQSIRKEKKKYDLICVARFSPEKITVF